MCDYFVKTYFQNALVKQKTSITKTDDDNPEDGDHTPLALHNQTSSMINHLLKTPESNQT
jgi:hypothetical protein